MSAFSLSSLGPLKHATGLNKQPLSFIPSLSVCDVNDIPVLQCNVKVWLVSFFTVHCPRVCNVLGMFVSWS